MKRYVFAAVALLALASTAAAGGASGGGADVVQGRGYAIPCPPGAVLPFPAFCSTTPREFRFAAIRAGGRAHGYFWQAGTFCSAPGVCTTGSFRARVLCVRATGKEATVGAVVEETSLPTHPVGRQVHFSVIDNGRGGDPLPDLLSLTFTIPVTEVEGECVAVLPPAYQTVVEGDIFVRDGLLAGP